jgi:hypothetical protein
MPKVGNQPPDASDALLRSTANGEAKENDAPHDHRVAANMQAKGEDRGCFGLHADDEHESITSRCPCLRRFIPIALIPSDSLRLQGHPPEEQIQHESRTPICSRSAGDSSDLQTRLDP